MILVSRLQCIHYRYHTHVQSGSNIVGDDSTVAVQVPLGVIAASIPLVELCRLVVLHGTFVGSQLSKAEVVRVLKDHHCGVCDNYLTLFKVIPIFSDKVNTVSSFFSRKSVMSGPLIHKPALTRPSRSNATHLSACSAGQS